MERAELGQKLRDLQGRYNLANFTDAVKNSITIELQCVLQDYLWEGQGSRKFNRQKYHQLALAWHTDKLKNLSETPQLSDELRFLLWYAKRVKGNDNAPFQAVNTESTGSGLRYGIISFKFPLYFFHYFHNLPFITFFF